MVVDVPTFDQQHFSVFGLSNADFLGGVNRGMPLAAIADTVCLTRKSSQVTRPPDR